MEKDSHASAASHNGLNYGSGTAAPINVVYALHLTSHLTSQISPHSLSHLASHSPASVAQFSSLPHTPDHPPSSSSIMSSASAVSNCCLPWLTLLMHWVVLLLLILSVSLPYFVTSSTFTDGSSYRRSQLSVGAFTVCTPGDHGQACSSSGIDGSCAVSGLSVTLPNCPDFNAFRYVLVVAVALWGVATVLPTLLACGRESLTLRQWKVSSVSVAVLGWVSCALMLAALLLQRQWASDSGVPDSARGACFGLLTAALAIGGLFSSLWLLSLLSGTDESRDLAPQRKEGQGTEMHASRMTPVVLTTSSSTSTL